VVDVDVGLEERDARDHDAEHEELAALGHVGDVAPFRAIFHEMYTHFGTLSQNFFPPDLPLQEPLGSLPPRQTSNCPGWRCR